VDTYLLICALILAVFAAIEDVRHRRIPNRLTYSGFLAALLVRYFVLGWPGFRDGLIASLGAGGLLFLLFLLRGMGAGDVKLMAAVGAWAGRVYIVNLLFAAVLAGGVIAVAVILYRKRVLVTLANTVELVRHHLTAGLQPHPELNIDKPGSMRVPFAPAIAVGTLYCLSRTLLGG
jgi:prepilin peptidase CpaA